MTILQKFLAGSSSLACLLSFSAPAQPWVAAGTRIDSIFSSYTRETPGAAVAVVFEGRVVFAKGYGMANLSDSVPITTRTVFDMASVSKQFTAFAIYLCAQEGKISLEDPVKKHISELPDFAGSVKIKHLLAHTSGLPDHGALLSLAGYQITDRVTTAQVLKMLARQRGLLSPPGTVYFYCNTNYTLLAEIIQRATGVSFQQYTNDKIFRPLGMHNTRFGGAQQGVIKHMAVSYEKFYGRYAPVASINAMAGPSGLLTTAEDLTKWVLNFEDPVVGSRQLLQAFNEVSYFDNGKKVFVRFDDGDSIFYAKGQFVSRYKGARRFGHGGHTASFRTFLGRFPDYRLGIIMVSNDEHNEDLGGRYEIADFYIPQHLQKPAPGTPAPTPSLARATENATVWKPDLGVFTGTFASQELDARYYLVADRDKLILRHIRLHDIVLQRTGPHTFTGSGPDTFFFQMQFTPDASGQMTRFTMSNWGAKNLRFDREDR